MAPEIQTVRDLVGMNQAMTAGSQNLKLQVTHISKLDASNLAQ